MIYEYRCKSCNHKWEVQAKVTDELEKVCPKCGEESAQRLISGSQGVQFKGQGWFNSGGY